MSGVIFFVLARPTLVAAWIRALPHSLCKHAPRFHFMPPSTFSTPSTSFYRARSLQRNAKLELERPIVSPADTTSLSLQASGVAAPISDPPGSVGTALVLQELANAGGHAEAERRSACTRDEYVISMRDMVAGV